MLRPLLTLQQLYHAVPTADAAAPGLTALGFTPVFYLQAAANAALHPWCVCLYMYVCFAAARHGMLACLLATFVKLLSSYVQRFCAAACTLTSLSVGGNVRIIIARKALRITLLCVGMLLCCCYVLC